MHRSALLAVLLSVVAAPPAHAIVGGTAAKLGEYPGVAEIVVGGSALCSGTLIDSTHVLTAGHCGSLTGAAVATPITWPTAFIDVKLGSNRAGKGTRVPVQGVSLPPDYAGRNDRHDIAILTLSKAVSYTPVQVAGARERSVWKAGTKATIVGWGRTGEDEDVPDTLQKARVPITTDRYCASRYESFDRETMVCAGHKDGGADTCQGDSGGPLFTRAPGRSLRVAGVTSWGEGCGAAGQPGVYARVADTKLRNWVASVAPRGVSRKRAPR